MNIIKNQRESLGFTQVELAEKSGLSLRTVQRMEVSSLPPKGHTLRMFADVFDLEASYILENFVPQTADELNVRTELKLLNLSSLGFFIFPFGNIFIPLILWFKWRKSNLVDEVGRKIINFQIVWTFIMCCALCVAPFINHPKGLIFYILIVAIIFNLIVVCVTATKIQRRNYDFLNIPIKLL